MIEIGLRRLIILKNIFLKFKISWRVGEASCEVGDKSVVVTGEAVTYLKGEIYVERI